MIILEKALSGKQERENRKEEREKRLSIPSFLKIREF